LEWNTKRVLLVRTVYRNGELDYFAVPLGSAVAGADFMACVNWFLTFCRNYYVAINTDILFI
jgi:hypothetical protein